MKNFILFVVLAVFFSGFSQDIPPSNNQGNLIESPTLRAIMLNPNVYRTRLSIKGVIAGKEDSNFTFKDSVYLNITDSKRWDYKIISEDLNGYVIIQVLEGIKFKKIQKDKITNAEVWKAATDSSTGITTFKMEKVPTITKYDMYEIVLNSRGEELSDEQDASQYYIAIKKDDFKPQSKILLATKFVGIPLVHPFKFRKKTADQGDELQGTLAVSYNFGLRLKLRNKDAFKSNFISIVPYGFGFGSEKYFKENSDGTTTASNKADAIAFTYYQGGVLLTLQKVNLGFFVGFDKMIGQKKDWVYQDRAWFSLGLGYKLGDF